MTRFKIIRNANGSYGILSKADESKGLCVLSASQSNGGSVVAYTYAAAGVDKEWYLQSAEFEWSDTPKADTYYYIRSDQNGQVMTVKNGSNEPYTNLVQNLFEAGEEQKFKLIPADSGYFYLQPAHSTDGKVLEVMGWEGLYYMKLRPMIAPGTGYNGFQKFRFIKTANGSYQIACADLQTDYLLGLYYNEVNSDLILSWCGSNNAGPVHQWVLEEISAQMTSSATYTADGNYMTGITDSRGNKTAYSYNTSKGVLNSTTNANNVSTNYAYNANNDSLTSVSQSGSTISYTYNKDKINTITTGTGTVYSFGYDNFNRNTTIKVGNQLLTSRMFDSQGKLTQSTYGNGQTIGYTYDKLDRVSEKKYNGVTKATYVYDNDGNVVQTTDGFTGITTKVSYDLIKRPYRVSQSNGQSIGFTYDDKNRVSAYTNRVGGTDTKTTFAYSETSQIDKVNTTKGALNLSQEYSFDRLSRVSTKKQELNGDAGHQVNYTYLKGSRAGITTNLIETVENQSGLSCKYEYDKLGNITRIYERASASQGFALKVSYTYDGLNQLKTETRNGTTITYNYDKAGNILSKVTTGGSSSTISYGYGDANWKDKLTSYNGQAITYDAIGNPLTYRDGMSFTWANGRNLATLKKGSTTAAYTYNTDGIRTKKVVNGVTTDFYLNGSDIVTQISGNDRLDFAYDANGDLYGFFYQNTPYLYVRNGQGDITAILDDSGDVVVNYEYDSWGNITKTTDSTTAKIGTLNPFRYRGYYFDNESGLYYLQSRYYDAGTGRFVNADAIVSSSGDIKGYNLFEYCMNNPVNMSDEAGHLPQFLIDFGNGVINGIKDTLTSISYAISHPVQTVKGIGSSIVNDPLGAAKSGVTNLLDPFRFWRISNRIVNNDFYGAGELYGNNLGDAAIVAGSAALSKLKVPVAQSNGIPFQTGKVGVQGGVDPNTLIPTKNLKSLNPNRIADAVKYGGGEKISVGRTGIIHNGHHRVADAIKNGRAIDIFVEPYK